MSYFWTTAEIRVLREHYEAGGPDACLPLLPRRTRSGVLSQARKLELGAPHVRRKLPPHSEWSDAQIRKLYQRRPKKGDIPALAQRLGWTRERLSRRAVQLGLVSPRLSEPEWSSEELEILERTSDLAPETARQHLLRAGYRRTNSAIVTKRKRLRMFRPEREDYSSRDLAVLMGVDSKTVQRWIILGMLEARRSGKGETSSYLIRDADVRKMIIRYTAEIDIRKIDKWYLVSVLTGADHAKANVMREAG